MIQAELPRRTGPACCCLHTRRAPCPGLSPSFVTQVCEVQLVFRLGPVGAGAEQSLPSGPGGLPVGSKGKGLALLGGGGGSACCTAELVSLCTPVPHTEGDHTFTQVCRSRPGGGWPRLLDQGLCTLRANRRFPGSCPGPGPPPPFPLGPAWWESSLAEAFHLSSKAAAAVLARAPWRGAVIGGDRESLLLPSSPGPPHLPPCFLPVWSLGMAAVSRRRLGLPGHGLGRRLLC